MQPAGFWRRCAAWTLDAALVAVPSVGLAAPGFVAHGAQVESSLRALLATLLAQFDPYRLSANDVSTLASSLAGSPAVRAAIAATSDAVNALLMPPLLWFVALATLYWIAFEASPWQATPGKRALGLQVARVDGTRATLPRTALRHAAGALSWLTLNLGHALAAWTRDKRALHDLLSGTNVFIADTADTAMPRWALAWLGLQAAIMAVGTFWLAFDLAALMRTAIDSALMGG